MKKKHKRGALFHWIVFGFLAALGIFLFLAWNTPAIQTEKGSWQFGFVYDTFFPAELALLEQDVKLHSLLQETLQELAAHGGFQTTSPCAPWEGKNILGPGCFPALEEELLQLFTKKLKEKYPEIETHLSEITFQETQVIGKGTRELFPTQEKKIPPSSVLKYTFNAGFSLEVKDFLLSYNKLQGEIFSLLSTCKNRQDLASCVGEEKPNLSGWNYFSCGEEQDLSSRSNTEGRKISFCVERDFLFQFALDFSPTEVFALRSTELTYLPTPERYEISFTPDAQAESYHIYYSNYPAFVKTVGVAEEIFLPVVSPWFKERKQISSLEECSEEKKENIAYLCEGRIFYQVKDARLSAEKAAIFAITVLRAGKESEVPFLLKVENGVVEKI